MIEQGLFKRHFVGRDGFQWWIGQLPPEESWRENISGNQQDPAKGFGERYRVRIIGYHTANADDIPDEELPWAYVMYPVTAGGGGRGSSQSANLTQGTFVFGFFIDGEDAQLPIIMGVLGHNDYAAVMKNVTPTRFIPFDGYPDNDEVMGQERSTLQVVQQGGQEVALQENASGQPVNEFYTSSAQGNTSQYLLADDKNNQEPPKPLSQTSECEKSPMGDIQRVLQNVMNEIHKFNQLLYDARGAISAGVTDIQRYIQNAIKKVTGKIAAAMKWVFTEMEKFILKQINNLSKLSYSLVFPDMREPLNVAMGQANDTIVCIIRNLIGELPDMVGDFMNQAAGAIQNPLESLNIPSPTKMVNVPRCFVEDFMANTLGNVTGMLTDAITDTLGAIDSITGGVTELIGGVMGFVEDLISFLTCGGMAETECPKVNEWSILSGPGSKGGASNIDSMMSKVQNVGSSGGGGASSLNDISFDSVFAEASCDVGPRPCTSPVVEYIGDGQGAQINLVVSNEGEILAGDIISSGVGFAEGKSYLKVYDDCGIGQGAVIQPIFDDVVGIPDPNYIPPTSNAIQLDDNGFPLGTQGQVILPDGSVIQPGIGTPRPTQPDNSPEESWCVPDPTTGRPGDSTSQSNCNPVLTQSGKPGEVPEVCRIVEFRLERGSSIDTAPIRVTFTLIGDPPPYPGDTSFSFVVDQAGTTQRTPCLYPNRDYMVTADTFRVPDTELFRGLLRDGLFDQDDPDNIRLRITDGVQNESATFGDYTIQTDGRPALQKGNGLWADFKDTTTWDIATIGYEARGLRKVGSAGPRDFQIYPNQGFFKEVSGGVSGFGVDHRVLFRIEPEPLPAMPLPPEVPPKGIVDVIVIHPGYDYLPAPNGDQGGDGAVWAPADSTVITGESNGSTDYYPPVPPGNTVGIPTDGVVTTPPDSNTVEGIDCDGNTIEVRPGVPTRFPCGGSITSPFTRLKGNRGPYPSTDAYPVILYLCELIIAESGLNYKPEDEIVIEPDMGATAVPKFDEFGRLISIKVTAGGEGFTTRPKVYIKTETGFGARIIPKFCIDRLGVDDLERNPDLQDKVVSVINCVGKF